MKDISSLVTFKVLNIIHIPDRLLHLPKIMQRIIRQSSRVLRVSCSLAPHIEALRSPT